MEMMAVEERSEEGIEIGAKRVVKIETPLIVLNEKAYAESMGEKGFELAEMCEEVAVEKGVNIAICPQQVELALIASLVNIPCFAQHVDAVDPGSHTGFTTLESVKEAGARGSLVNHSEHRLKIAEIDFIIKKAASLNLLTIVCTNNITVSKAVAELKPYAIAVEPPELIGTGQAVSKVDPGIVENTVKEVKQVDEGSVVLCGAGVTNGEDVRAAIELGADGVLLASGVVKAKDPKAALRDLVSGL
ncbi:MAG: triose-phosphate isomerase [Methanophagales archaeon]|nr:triose-phosphate isomerase [Methanophagales archaeon]MCW3141483.1 triose-phosphate isomerase [Methanophagales archaeon]